jgi:hypothetical protein
MFRICSRVCHPDTGVVACMEPSMQIILTQLKIFHYLLLPQSTYLIIKAI